MRKTIAWVLTLLCGICPGFAQAEYRSPKVISVIENATGLNVTFKLPFMAPSIFYHYKNTCTKNQASHPFMSPEDITEGFDIPFYINNEDYLVWGGESSFGSCETDEGPCAYYYFNPMKFLSVDACLAYNFTDDSLIEAGITIAKKTDRTSWPVFGTFKQLTWDLLTNKVRIRTATSFNTFTDDAAGEVLQYW